MPCAGDQGFNSTMFPNKNFNVKMLTFHGGIRNVCISPDGISSICCNLGKFYF
jgi:hypothetical protein